MPARPTITGSVLLDDQPLAGQDVLLITADMERLLDASTTGPDGRFSHGLSARATPAAVGLLAKIKAGVVTMLYQEVAVPQAEPAEFRVESQAGFVTITGTVDSTVAWPPHLSVFLTPVSIDGLPEHLHRFVNQKAKGVIDAHFFETVIQEPRFTIRVAPGVYAIGGAYLNYDRPMTPQPDYQNVIVQAATMEPTGEALEGAPHGGFRLRADRDCQIRLTLRVVENSEL